MNSPISGLLVEHALGESAGHALTTEARDPSHLRTSGRRPRMVVVSHSFENATERFDVCDRKQLEADQ